MDRSTVATVSAGSAASPLRAAARRTARLLDATAQFPLRVLLFLVIFYIAACMVGAALYGLASGGSAAGAAADPHRRP